MRGGHGRREVARGQRALTDGEGAKRDDAPRVSVTDLSPDELARYSRHIMLPEKNRADLEKIPAEIKKKLTFKTVKTIDQALRYALALSE